MASSHNDMASSHNDAFLPPVSASARAQVMSPQAATLALRDDDGVLQLHSFTSHPALLCGV